MRSVYCSHTCASIHGILGNTHTQTYFTQTWTSSPMMITMTMMLTMVLVVMAVLMIAIVLAAVVTVVKLVCGARWR